MGQTPPKVKWLELPREQRRRVSRAVRRGRALDDARDAPYAVAFADASLEWLSWNRRFRPVHLLLATLVVADLVFAGGWRPALLLYPLLGFGFLVSALPGCASAPRRPERQTPSSPSAWRFRRYRSRCPPVRSSIQTAVSGGG